MLRVTAGSAGRTPGFGRRWRSFVAAVSILFLGSACTSLGGGASPSALQTQAAAAATALEQLDFPAAQRAFAAAHQLAPEDGYYALRLGYVEEELGDYEAAAQAYREGLAVPTLSAELRRDLAYRLALLEAFRLNNPGELPALLAQLPPDSPQAADLQAVIALVDKDVSAAFAALNRARAVPLDGELSAIILYHAARAYHLVGDDERAVQYLYDAISRAGYAPVARDIDELRNLIKGRSGH